MNKRAWRSIVVAIGDPYRRKQPALNKAAKIAQHTVSRRGLARAFIGNTAERVIDQVNCDVMVVKPAKFRPAVPRRRSMKL